MCIGEGFPTLCSSEKPVRVVAGVTLNECKDMCSDDPVCQGGYHANGLPRQKISSKRRKTYDPACYVYSE